MAVTKTITIDGQEVAFRASAAIPRLYRIKFHRDIYRDLDALQKSMEGSDENASTLDTFSLELFENISYIMARHADPSVPDSPEEWLERFSTFSIYQVLPQIIELSSIWNNIKSTVTSLMNTLKSSVVSIWNNMKSAISGVISQILSVIQSGFNSAVNFIKGLIGQAYSWGRDLIMGIVNGIRSAIGAVADAARSVADSIRSFLHFSVPDVGPLTDYESWMPDFMKGLAKGIEKSKGLVAGAMEGVAAGMNLSPMLAGTPALAAAGAGTDSASMMQQLMTAVAGMENGSGGDITIPVYIGQDRIDEIVVTAAQRANYRSGGR